MSDGEGCVECCVCMEAKPASQLSSCPNSLPDAKHTVCTACAREMVAPAVCGNDMCCGIHVSCPVCRIEVCVVGAHLLHIIVGCDKRSGAKFKHADGPAKWAAEIKRRRQQGQRVLQPSPLPPSRSN